jgi:hypothetical protein
MVNVLIAVPSKSFARYAAISFTRQIDAIKYAKGGVGPGSSEPRLKRKEDPMVSPIYD